METYGNNSQDSAILGYKAADDCIIVEFRVGEYPFYKYSATSLGELHIAIMKELARQGDGLGEYISRNLEVKNGYERRGNSLGDVE